MQPQRLIVPLFQRPYVWNEESQWQPLWDDVVRLTDRLLAQPHAKQFPHFLGAVVLQLVQKPTGTMQERTIIDGQQRLTTLQLLLDALHAELLSVNATAPAMRLEPLIVNAKPFCRQVEDRYKVWPTNRDRPAFNAVMSAEPPVGRDDARSGSRVQQRQLNSSHRTCRSLFSFTNPSSFMSQPFFLLRPQQSSVRLRGGRQISSRFRFYSLV